jgi:hypothetical protein
MGSRVLPCQSLALDNSHQSRPHHRPDSVGAGTTLIPRATPKPQSPRTCPTPAAAVPSSSPNPSISRHRALAGGRSCSRAPPGAATARCWTYALFAWLISHQPAVLFSQNKSATNNQPAVLFLSAQTSISHQPPAKRTAC